MNHWFRRACAGVLLAGMLTSSALAADFTACAEHLDDLGLFHGTGDGYALDRVLTRGEASAMLVRLLGAEEEAQSLPYDAPFTDLAQWQKPYVQYLYDNGLANGVSETFFDPDSACSAQMYAAFLLRALDYREADGDFTYAEAAAAAQALGLYNPAVIDTETFLRDDAAAASYTALSLCPKGSDGTLLDRLVAAGAVDAQAAAPYQALFADYADYGTDTGKMDSLTQFAVQSALQATLSRADGQPLAVSTDCYTVFDRTAGTAVSDGALTLSAPSVSEDYVQAYTIDASSLSPAARAGMLYGYGRVPLACIDAMEQTRSGWRFTFDLLPALYQQTLWPITRAAGDWTPEGAVLEQSVRGGRITFQQLETSCTADGLSGTVTLTGRLDTNP